MSRRLLSVRSALAALFIGCAVSCLFAAAARADRWRDVRRFDPFVCHADFDLGDRVRLLADLQRLQRDLVAQLQLRASTEPVELYLLRDRDRYRDYLKSLFPGVTPRRAMFVKGRGRSMVFAYRSRELEIDLRHECTHAVLHASLSNIPLWLDEGLAEYFEVPQASRAAGHPHLKALLDSNSSNAEIPPLVALERHRDLAEMGLTEYRYSWAWVHYMLHGPRAAREELTGFLADLESDQPTEPLSRRLKRRLPDSQARLLEHLRTWAD